MFEAAYLSLPVYVHHAPIRWSFLLSLARYHLSLIAHYQLAKTQARDCGDPTDSPNNSPAHESEIMEESQSLHSLFSSARDDKSALESRGDVNTEAYRDAVNATIAKFQECQRQISILSLFSSNESLDDVSTGDLQYYHRA